MFDEPDENAVSYVETIATAADEQSPELPVPIRETPYLYFPPDDPPAPSESPPAATDSASGPNRWKCQLQYMRKHPTHFTKILTYIAASFIVYVSQGVSGQKKRDSKHVDKSIAVTGNILHSYLMAVITLFLTVNVLFLFVLSSDPDFGIQDLFPNIQRKWNVQLDSDTSYFSLWYFFAIYGPYYIFHNVMDVLRPAVAQRAKTSLVVFCTFFAAVFVMFQSDLLSFNRGLEFLRFEAPTVQSVVKNGPLHDGKIFLWTLVLFAVLSAFVEFVVLTKPKFSIMDVARDPQKQLEKWAAEIMKPASVQYMRLLGMFLVALFLWIPVGMFFTVNFFVLLAWFAVPMYSEASFSRTWSAIWNYKDKIIQRIFSSLVAALALINLKDSIQNIRHSIVSPVMAVFNVLIFAVALLFFIFSFAKPAQT